MAFSILLPNPMHRSAQARREYHNKAERARTRKINALIQELRQLLAVPESDKATILSRVVERLSEEQGSITPS